MRGSQTPRLDPRSAILEAGLTLLSDDPRVPLAQIAERAGVGRATLHRYFKSREDLVRELALLSIREIDDAVARLDQEADSAVHLLRLIIEAVIPLGNRFHFLANESWTASEPFLKAELDRQLASLTDLVEQCKAEGAMDAAVPSSWIVGAIDSLIYAAWSLVASGHIAPRDASSLLMRTLLKGISG